jgi:hypothetical protein
MVVALLLPRLLENRSDRQFMLFGGVLLTAGLFTGLTQPALAGLLPIWFLLGAGSSLVQTPAARLLLRSAHEGDRPALYAAQFALSHACWLVAYPVAGWAGAAFDLWFALLVLGLIAGIGTLAAFRLWPEDDQAELEHVHEAVTHTHRHVHDEHHQHSHDGAESQEAHTHPHEHEQVTHVHAYVIDLHHPEWPINTGNAP